MEHETEKTIRDKVNSLDETSIAWKKEFVWSEIRSGTTSRSRSNLFYYVAASLILLITVFSLIEISKRKQFDARLKLLEAGINQVFNSSVSADHVPSGKIDIACIDIETSSIAQKKTNQKPSNEQTITINNYVSDHSVANLNEEVDIDIPIEQPLIASIPMSEVTPNQKKKTVHAIFSSETSPTITSTSNTNKKIKLRLFRQEEETESDIIIREPINLTARINKK